MGSKEKPGANQKGKPRLQLKGRIYMANVTEIISLQRPGLCNLLSYLFISLLTIPVP
jgi:hypothetical protein